MKNQKINKTIKAVAFYVVLLTVTTSNAQIGFPSDNVDDEAPAAPIDGLIGIGLAAGAYFGLRKKIKE